MTINRSKKDILNYIIHYAEETYIDIFSYINIKHTGDNQADLEKYLFPNGEVDMNAADNIAMYLGINSYDLLHCNNERLESYIDSFDFFKLKKEYDALLQKSHTENAVVFVSFSKITRLIKAYNEMCNEYINIFNKKMKLTSLFNISTQEIERFSFLASVLKASDAIYLGNDLLNISLLYRFLDVYRAEIINFDISDIVEFRSIDSLNLGYCIDFLNNLENMISADEFAPNWRDGVKKFIKEIKSEEKNIYILDSDNKCTLLCSIERENMLADISENIEFVPVDYRTLEERFIYNMSSEAEERRAARDKIPPLTKLPQTFDQCDFIERECGLDRYFVDTFIQAQFEFLLITALNEDDEPDEFRDALLTYAAGAMGLSFDDAEKMYEKQQEFLENY